MYVCRYIYIYMNMHPFALWLVLIGDATHYRPLVVSEDAGVAALVVDRVSGSTGIVSVVTGPVGYPEGGSAIANTHFVAGTSTLAW